MNEIIVAAEQGRAVARQGEPSGTPAAGVAQSGVGAEVCLDALFSRHERVGIFTRCTVNMDDQVRPLQGDCSRTAGELVHELGSYGYSLESVFGQYDEHMGILMMVNPVDGTGLRRGSIRLYRHMVLQCLSGTRAEQIGFLERSWLPVSLVLDYGDDTVSAVVDISSGTEKEFTECAREVERYCRRHQMVIDRDLLFDPCAAIRLPGCYVNGNLVSILKTSLGSGSWEDWQKAASADCQDFPAPVMLDGLLMNPPPLHEELISGILRVGHKMQITGDSKAGKTFLLMHLAICIAEGLSWLGFPCRQGKVLYIDLEVDPGSSVQRFRKIYEALGIPFESAHASNISIWHLRGHGMPLDKLIPLILRAMEGKEFSAMILDPIYKVLTGNENEATDMAYFCRQFDIICNETGSAVIYSHHHTKGMQGTKKTKDRGSGSGVFNRDPDALLDLLNLVVPGDGQDAPGDVNRKAFRLESTLREFPDIEPINLWFRFPLHVIDETGELDQAAAEGTGAANRSKSPKRVSEAQRRDSIERAFVFLSNGGAPVSLREMAEYCGVEEKTIRNRVKEMEPRYYIANSLVYYNPNA